jgi:hypothetical protein
MLGVDGTRHYLVVFQNDAEARGTGGLVGAYAVVEAGGGRVSVQALGTDSDLRSASAPVVDLGPNYRALFGQDPGLWANTNLSADFPSGASTGSGWTGWWPSTPSSSVTCSRSPDRRSSRTAPSSPRPASRR